MAAGLALTAEAGADAAGGVGLAPKLVARLSVKIPGKIANLVNINR